MDQNANNSAIIEKRRKPRIKCSYSAIVRGCTMGGKKIEESATVLNLSADGAYLVLPRTIKNGQDLAVKIAFPTGSLDLGTSKLAATAVVVRTELFSEGVLGIAIKFQHYRFL